MKAWKAFRVNSKGELLFLFHGLNGSRKVKRGEWLEANQKMVTDGSGSTEYLSGFHVFLTEEEIPHWKKRTRLPSTVLEVEVKRVKKKWSNKNIGVAKYLKVYN